jgi:hypothetical protein
MKFFILFMFFSSQSLLASEYEHEPFRKDYELKCKQSLEDLVCKRFLSDLKECYSKFEMLRNDIDQNYKNEDQTTHAQYITGQYLSARIGSLRKECDATVGVEENKELSCGYLTQVSSDRTAVLNSKKFTLNNDSYFLIVKARSADKQVCFESVVHKSFDGTIEKYERFFIKD